MSMNRNTFRIMAAAVAAASAGACGGTTAPVGESTTKEVSTLSALQTGASAQRAYLGDNQVTLGASPVLASMDLLGGSQLELEVVTPDSSPVHFEVWRARGDGTVTLEMPVEARSGFALENIDPVEDGTWLLLFPGRQRGDVTVHTDCVGGLRGCAQTRQPGETCPPGWACDVGLACQLPVGVCGPLAGAGTCVPQPGACPEGGDPVCGCDGRTYASECDARLRGVPVLRAESCEEGAPDEARIEEAPSR
jgi:hypothetical protein